MYINHSWLHSTFARWWNLLTKCCSSCTCWCLFNSLICDKTKQYSVKSFTRLVSACDLTILTEVQGAASWAMSGIGCCLLLVSETENQSWRRPHIKRRNVVTRSQRSGCVVSIYICMLHVIGNENCWTSEFTACSAVITILHFGKEKKRKITKTVQQTLIQSWISLPFLVLYNLK